jgi:hypothetical protein
LDRPSGWIITYIDQRPERMHERFELLALEVLQQSWPCQKVGGGRAQTAPLPGKNAGPRIARAHCAAGSDGETFFLIRYKKVLAAGTEARRR